MTDTPDHVRISQYVTPRAGFAYGTIGADIHVFGDGTPLYLLTNHRQADTPAASWLSAMPSRMLDARFGVVEFTGRQAERTELHRWCQARTRLAIRWMYGPGGQGKTRLANMLASDATAGGWKVVTATQGTSVLPPPGSQDVRTAGTAGLLLIVDYADRWPLHHLTWLLSNALLYQNVPTRVLLLARSNRLWPALHAEIDGPRVQADAYELKPLTDTDNMRERVLMFIVARDCFARRYGLSPTDAESIQPPAALTEPDFGSVLSIHMAALAAVDARAHHVVSSSTDAASLSTYLLRREQLHWTALYENRLKGADFTTAPSVMARAVFVAGLLGPVGHGPGLQALKMALGDLKNEVSLERVLADHSLCYSPTDAGYALEPLYPDRLAEDFLALCVPGHSQDYQAESWAQNLLFQVVAAAQQMTADRLLSRSFGFLADAAIRWEHLVPTVGTILKVTPEVAVRAGANTLMTISRMDALPIAARMQFVRLIIRGEIPRHRGLDFGVALMAERVLQEFPDQHYSEKTRALVTLKAAQHFAFANLDERAVPAYEKAIDLWTAIVDTKSSRADLSILANAYTGLSRSLGDAGDVEGALEAAHEAYDLRKILIVGRDFYKNSIRAFYAEADLGSTLIALERYSEAKKLLKHASWALGNCRKKAKGDTHNEIMPALSSALSNLSYSLLHLGEVNKAIDAGLRAIDTAHADDRESVGYAERLASRIHTQLDCILDIERLSRGSKSFQELTSPISGTITDAIGALEHSRSFDSNIRCARLRNYQALLLTMEGEESSIHMLQDATVQAAHALSSDAVMSVPEAYSIYSRVLLLIGKLGDAEQAQRRAAEEWYSLVEYTRSPPQQRWALRKLSLALSDLATLLRKLGRVIDAIDIYSRSADILRDLAKGDVKLYKLLLAADLHDLVVCYKAIGEEDLAERTAKDAAKL